MASRGTLERERKVGALRLFLALASTVVLVGMFVSMFYFGGRDTDARLKADEARLKKETAQAAKKRADLAVSTLPPGVEDAWRTFIADRAASVIRREGNLVAVNAGGPVSYVSLNSAYTITCNLLDPTIVFGNGEDAVVAHLRGDDRRMALEAFKAQLAAADAAVGAATETNSNAVWNEGTRFPALRVDPGSVAAKRLSAELCSLAAGKVSETMRP